MQPTVQTNVTSLASNGKTNVNWIIISNLTKKNPNSDLPKHSLDKSYATFDVLRNIGCMNWKYEKNIS